MYKLFNVVEAGGFNYDAIVEGKDFNSIKEIQTNAVVAWFNLVEVEGFNDDE